MISFAIGFLMSFTLLPMCRFMNCQHAGYFGKEEDKSALVL